MSAELISTKLNHESHILLDQPLLRLPQEQLRKNFKTAQKYVERESKDVIPALKAAANASLQGKDAAKALQSLDSVIHRMTGLKRRMEQLHEEEQSLHHATRRRLQHLQSLYEMESLADVKYERWSRLRLDRLLIEYMVRQGYTESARLLAQDKGVDALVDIQVFERACNIAKSLRAGGLEQCLAWCAEHKVIMKKLDNRLEFELRLQQYIELCRARQLLEARDHARKYFSAFFETQKATVLVASALLIFPPDKEHQYSRLYHQSRWDYLASLFTETHHQLFTLPSRPLLLIALSAGLSALKTPSCHSKHASSTANASSTATSVCPICSTELNELARKLPYAHHTKSYVDNDLVALPSGRVYSKPRLLEYCKKLSLDDGWVKDPITSEVWSHSDLAKVYIT